MSERVRAMAGTRLVFTQQPLPTHTHTQVAAPMVVPGAPYVPVAAAGAPGYFPPAMGAAPAGAAYSGPSMYSVASASAMSNRMVSTRSSHALQHAGSSFMGRPQAVQPPPPVTRSVPGSTQKTPRGASSARRPRTNSTGSFYGNGHSSRWQVRACVGVRVSE